MDLRERQKYQVELKMDQDDETGSKESLDSVERAQKVMYHLSKQINMNMDPDAISILRQEQDANKAKVKSLNLKFIDPTLQKSPKNN